jgi:hypothetical protein
LDLNLSPGVIIYYHSLIDPKKYEGDRHFPKQRIELPDRGTEKAGEKRKNGIFPPDSNSCCFINKFAVYNKIVILFKGHKIT